MKSRLEQIDCIAARMEKAAKVLIAYDSQRLQDAILKADPSIINDLKRFGVERIYGSGYVIHHFKNAPYHYLSKSKNRKYDYAELARILNDKNYKKVIRKRIIEEELPHTVLLPEWFHNWCTKHKNRIEKLTTRKEYYNLMAGLLKSKKTYNEIKALQFNNKTFYSALKSIEALAITAEIDYREKVMNTLNGIFDELRESVMQYMNKTIF